MLALDFCRKLSSPSQEFTFFLKVYFLARCKGKISISRGTPNPPASARFGLILRCTVRIVPWSTKAAAVYVIPLGRNEEEGEQKIGCFLLRRPPSTKAQSRVLLQGKRLVRVVALQSSFFRPKERRTVGSENLAKLALLLRWDMRTALKVMFMELGRDGTRIEAAKLVLGGREYGD